MKRLYVVGIGPGDAAQMTIACRTALCAADTLIGYTKYIELVASFFPQKKLLTTGMRQEEARCHKALALAAAGETTALICSGDAGVYGMAGLVYELSPQYPPLEIEVVPGVTAAMAGAALLGAPLTNDFAVISLSDLFTPWPLIEKRLNHAAAADFCLALYNPASQQRRDHLRRATEILLQHKAPDTLCGLARCIGREGQSASLLTLAQLADAEADMFTTVFIGNAETKEISGKMVTPRGYHLD